MRVIVILVLLFCLGHTYAQQRPHNSSPEAEKAYGVKGSNPGECKSYGVNEVLTQILSSYLQQHGDSVFLFYYRKRTIAELIENPNDGIALDLVCKTQFHCDQPNDLDPSPVFDGFMLPPVYRNDLFKNNRFKEGRFLSFVGKIPKDAPRCSEMQINVILIQNGMACRYSYPVIIERGQLPDLSISPMWCKTKGTLKKGQAGFKRHFSIPFQKNDQTTDSFYFERLSRLVKIFDGAITKIEINAYSSVEGTRANNIELQKGRAAFIEKFITDRLKQKTTFVKNAAENWPLFRKQIHEGRYKPEISDTSAEKLRAEVNRKESEPLVASLLDEQREASITLYVGRRFDDTIAANFLPLVIYDGIEKNDTAQVQIAYSRMIDAWQRGEIDKYFLTAIEVPLRPEYRSLVNNYLASVLVGSDIFNFAPYDDRYYEYIDSAEAMFPGFKPLAFNLAVYKTHLYLRSRIRDSVAFRQLSREVEAFKSDPELDKTLTGKLVYNYYLTASIYYSHLGYYDESGEYFRKVKPLLRLSNLTAHDVVEIARYFNFFNSLRDSQELLESYFSKYPDNADMAYLYVSNGSIYNLLAHYHVAEYYKQIDHLAKLDRDRLCFYFNTCYQLTRPEEVRAKMCSYCTLNYSD